VTRFSTLTGLVAAGAIGIGAGAALPGAAILAARADVPEPPARLSATGLFAPGSPSTPSADAREYSPQYPLWSDGLSKRRWIHIPAGTHIDATRRDDWQFPVGTRFWKEFSLGDRRIETRMLWRASDTRWVFATYAWSEDGSDARLVPEDGAPTAVEVARGRHHAIPSRPDCTACHGTEPKPLGFNALQLSTDRDPHAIHGEPARPGRLSLRDLVAEGVLEPASPALVTAPPRIRTASPETRAVLGYLAANCGTCHNGTGAVSAAGPVIRISDLQADGDAVARALVGQRTRWQVPGVAAGASVLVNPEAPESSAIVARMRSRSPSSQMPPLGTVIRDEAAVERLAAWIGTLQTR
jgi:hypothetical protein